MADFVPSAPFEAMHTQTNGDRGDAPDVKNKYDQRCGSGTVLLYM